MPVHGLLALNRLTYYFNLFKKRKNMLFEKTQTKMRTYEIY
jgi:hypothetical protein